MIHIRVNRMTLVCYVPEILTGNIRVEAVHLGGSDAHHRMVCSRQGVDDEVGGDGGLGACARDRRTPKNVTRAPNGYPHIDSHNPG